MRVSVRERVRVRVRACMQVHGHVGGGICTICTRMVGMCAYIHINCLTLLQVCVCMHSCMCAVMRVLPARRPVHPAAGHSYLWVATTERNTMTGQSTNNVTPLCDL